MASTQPLNYRIQSARNNFDRRYNMAHAAYIGAHDRVLEYLADAILARHALARLTGDIVHTCDIARFAQLDRLTADVEAQEHELQPVDDFEEAGDTLPSFQMTAGGLLALTVLDIARDLRSGRTRQQGAAVLLENAVRKFEAAPRG